jgi:hypothetical protein
VREYTVIEFATGSVWVFGPSGGILRDDLKGIEEARQFIEEQAVVSRYPRVVNMTLSQNQAAAEDDDQTAVPDPEASFTLIADRSARRREHRAKLHDLLAEWGIWWTANESPTRDERLNTMENKILLHARRQP